MIGLRNCIKNGNFNTWVGAASDSPNNWTAELTATLLRETNTAPNIVSNYHVKITGVGAADEGIEIAGGAANYLKVNPSTEYTFSIYYKATAGDEAGIKITSFNQAVEGTAHVDVELTETGWTRYHITFTTDADADNLQIQLLAANDTDIVYFCGGMLAEGDAAWAYTDRVDAGGVGDMEKSTYDTGNNGIVDKSETIDDGAGNAASAADVKSAVDDAHTQGTDQKLDDGGGNEVTAANAKDAVDKKHTQGTDQKLDDGGGNEVTVANAKDAVDKKHAQNTDTALGAQSENLDMNTHKVVGVVDPTANQEAATKKYVDDNTGVDPKNIFGPLPFYGDGSDGTPDFSAGGAIATYIKQYAALTIPVGQTVTCAKEVTIIAVQGTCTITGILTAKGKGGAAGAIGGYELIRSLGGAGAGAGGGGGGGMGVNGNGVSGSAGSTGGASGGSGGGGAAGGAGALSSPSAGAGGSIGNSGNAPAAMKAGILIYGDKMDLAFGYGAGGGSGGAGGQGGQTGGGGGGAGGAGGAGGGSIIIICKELVFDGTINVSGDNGSNGSAGSNHATSAGGGGGGGAGGGGGSIIIITATITTNTGTKTIIGGTPGSGGAGGIDTTDGNSNGGAGGAGGANGYTGRSQIESI